MHGWAANLCFRAWRMYILAHFAQSTYRQDHRGTARVLMGRTARRGVKHLRRRYCTVRQRLIGRCRVHCQPWASVLFSCRASVHACAMLWLTRLLRKGSLIGSPLLWLIRLLRKGGNAHRNSPLLRCDSMLWLLCLLLTEAVRSLVRPCCDSSACLLLAAVLRTARGRLRSRLLRQASPGAASSNGGPGDAPPAPPAEGMLILVYLHFFFLPPTPPPFS
jgi:hypothetical protein